MPAVIIVIVVLVILVLFLNRKPTADSDFELPVSRRKPIAPNDKLILVQNISMIDLKKILTDFNAMYNDEKVQVVTRLINIDEKKFAITFPQDPGFEIFCYLVNYMYYPMGIEVTKQITGWTTAKTGETWISNEMANKKMMLFIPDKEREYDNVYLTLKKM